MSKIDTLRRVMNLWLEKADEARASGDAGMVEVAEHASMLTARALAADSFFLRASNTASLALLICTRMHLYMRNSCMNRCTKP